MARTERFNKEEILKIGVSFIKETWKNIKMF